MALKKMNWMGLIKEIKGIAEIIGDSKMSRGKFSIILTDVGNQAVIVTVAVETIGWALDSRMNKKSNATREIEDIQNCLNKD